MSSTTSNIKLRILVVDDESDILLGLNAVLSRQNHTVKTFDNSSEALKHLTSSEVTPYDLVITDYRMPGGISGLDLAKRIKEHTRRKTKVFLMTAFDVSSLREFSEAMTSEIVDEIIQKPIPNDKLIAIMEKSFLHHNH
jgi:DNA-binding NtrC family response regulator